MNDSAHIYRAVILRAVLGPKAHATKAHDLERLNKIAQHLADCEEAQRIIRRKGYGKAGMTFIELACSVPDHVRGLLRGLFKPSGANTSEDRAKMDEAFDIWTSR